MLNEIEMEGKDQLAVVAEEGIEACMGGVCVEGGINESEAATHAKDVRIDRHGGQTEAEQEHASGGLWSYSGELAEPATGLLQRKGAQQLERELSGPVSFSMAHRMRWMRGALRFANPPERIAAATSSTGADMTARQLGKQLRREAKARSVFTSDVCWDRTVAISSSRGSPCERQSGRP
jgi:hypothetical protein